MTDAIISKTIFLAAPRETVWTWLTEREKLRQWFHPAEADLVQGEDYALVEEHSDGNEKLCWGRVLQMDPPSSMVWSFTVKPLNGALTTVSWTLESVQDGTQLTLKHEGVGQAAGAAALSLLMALDAGWDEHFARLRGVTAKQADSTSA